MVVLPDRREIRWQPSTAALRARADPARTGDSAGPCRAPRLQDQRGRRSPALRPCPPAAQRDRATRAKTKSAAAGSAMIGGAAMKGEPVAAASHAGSSHSGVSCRPGSAAPRRSPVQRRRARQTVPADEPARPRHRIEHRAKRRLRIADRIGEPAQIDRAHARMLRMVKNCTRVAAAARPTPRARACLRRCQRRDHRLQQRSRAGSCSSASATRPVRPARRRARRYRHGRPGPAARTVQRVTVISPRLNGAPPPPARPRTITSPLSGPRSAC